VNGGVVLGKLIKLLVVVALLVHGRAAIAQTNDTGGVPSARAMNQANAPAEQPAASAPTEGRTHTRKHSASCKQLGSKKGLKGSHLRAFLKTCEAKRLAE
jgi:hypothetical protein